MITPLGDINRLLKQMHEPDEYYLTPYDLMHEIYWIWILNNAVINDLAPNLRKNVKEHARFDVFVNGQFIGPRDYIIEQFGKDIIVKFKKQNFDYILETSDVIKLEGDFQIKEIPQITLQSITPTESYALRYIANEDGGSMIQENGDKLFLI